MPWDALIEALATRPEILGIVALAGVMGWMVKRRKGSRANGGKNGTPYFDLAIKAQSRGILLLGAVIVIREVGKIVVVIFQQGG